MRLSICFLILPLNIVWAFENLTLNLSPDQDDVMNSVKQNCQLTNMVIGNLQHKIDDLKIEINHKFEELKAMMTSKRDCECSGKVNNFENEHPITNLSPYTRSEYHIPPYYPADCAEAMKSSYRGNGIYKIQLPDSDLKPFDVYCEAGPNGTAYTVIQRRVDASVNFEVGWIDYVRGFGDLEGNFWIGLRKLYELTRWTVNELRIIMEDFDKNTAYASYSNFRIGGEEESFVLKTLGKYKGTAGDSLWLHKGSKFSTYDRDNDNYRLNCAEIEKGAWWYYSCYISNLNGRYLGANVEGDGMVWTSWRRYQSLKNVKMLIRRENIV